MSKMNKTERFIGYAVIIVLLFLGIKHASASTWDFSSGETFAGGKVCKLLTIDRNEVVVFGLINGQVIFASARPLNVVVSGFDADIEHGYGLRLGKQFYQGTIKPDPRHTEDLSPSVQQMFMGPYGEKFNDRFMAQDAVKVKAGYGRRGLERSYNLEGAKALYDNYKTCMGWSS